MKTKNFTERKMELAGWPVKITSYQWGERFYSTVDNVSPGAWIAKAEGSTREEAEKKVIERASELLAKTRRMKVSA